MAVRLAKVVARLPNRAWAAPTLVAVFISLGALVALLEPRGPTRNLDLWFLGFLLVAIGILPLLTQWWCGEFDPFSMRIAFLSVYLLAFSGWLAGNAGLVSRAHTGKAVGSADVGPTA